jgi:hypothetical protein
MSDAAPFWNVLASISTAGNKLSPLLTYIIGFFKRDRLPPLILSRKIARHISNNTQAESESMTGSVRSTIVKRPEPARSSGPVVCLIF